MKFKLNAQIYVGFTVALLLVLGVGVSSYFSIKNQAEDSQWVTYTYRVQSVADRMIKMLLDMESGRRGYRATKNEKFLEAYNKGKTQVPLLMNELKSLIKDPANKKNAQVLESKINDALAFWRTLDDGVVVSSDALTNTTIEKEKMDAVRAAFNTFNERQQELLGIRSKNSEDASSNARAILLLGTLVILVVVLALMFFILKEFSNRKKAEQQAEESYQNVLRLNNESDKRNWVLNGVSKINDSLQGSTHLKDLCSTMIDAVLNYTAQPAAAVYVFDAEQNKLQLEAISGVSKIGKKSYWIGDSIVGQAAKRKEIISVNDIPAKYVNISSGIVDGQPATAMYVPLFMGEELKGVIEIFSWSNFSQEQKDFFEMIGNNVAIAINSAQANAEAKKLFEEVRHQKEILEAQQEELRQTNEELTKQAEELQASEEELKVQEEELRQINAELEEKNEAVETALRALDIKAKELELTSKYKSEFLANMSHELRTPLNSILILAKLLADNQPKNLSEKQIEYAGIIHKSGNDLLQLINDILDLSKIEAGKITLQIGEVSISDIENDVKLTFQALAQQKGVEFISSIDAALPQTLQTDKQRLEQVIKNLLSNAFKFTPQGGTVSLNFYLKDKRSNLVAISVKDSGIGIPPEKQQLIFEAFQQADGSTSRRYGGTGLGLSISRELMHLLGGKIELTSKANKGSEFTLILPLRKDNTKPVVKPASQEPAIKAANVEEQTDVEDDRKDIQPDDKTMLIVEDEEFFATILRDFARSKGYKTIVALRGDEGLYCASHYVPSAIILDMKLPEVDGATILQKLKADRRTKNIPVHIISGAKDTAAMQTEAIAWLEKPVSETDLEKAFSKIQEVLQSKLKKVLLYTHDERLLGDIKSLLQHHNNDMQFEYARTIKEAQLKCAAADCDCIIVDMGKNVEKELKNIKAIKETIGDTHTPFIICIDKDISAPLEMELKKLSDVVIRTSSSSNQRLMEELELFLYKVQETGNGNGMMHEVKVAETNTGELAGKKVLLADDDMRNVFSLNAALEMQEMQVVTASDGKEAIQLLKENPNVDIVLMDIMMPEMDGYDAIKYIRKDMNLKKLPIIALTAKAMTGDRDKAIEAGASDYITKPVDLQKLFSLMRVWISQ